MTEESMDENVRGSVPSGARKRDQQREPSVNSVPVYKKSLKKRSGDIKNQEGILQPNISATSMPGQFVLINGVNSYLGFDVLATILQAGYHVCAAVDGQPVIDWIRSSPAVQPYLANLDMVIVSDLTDSASDEPLKAVVGVAHIASSLALPAGNHVQNDLEPGIHVTITMLNASQQAYPQPSVPNANQAGAYNFSGYLTTVLAPHFTILSTMETFVISTDEIPSDARDASRREDHASLETILGVRNTESFVGSISLMLTTWRRYMLAHYM